MSKGFLMIVSGPAGTGKGTVCKELLSRNEDIKFSVSATTRKPRVGEVDGVNYHFLEEEKFKSMIDKGEFLEHAFVHTNYYGTPKQYVLDEIEKGEIVLLEIDVQGALQIKKNYPEAIFIFLLPPSMEELKNRIVNRGTESLEDIERRLKNAYTEINLMTEYDYVVVNHEIDQAVDQVETIVKAEKLKVKRHSDKIEKLIGKEGK